MIGALLRKARQLTNDPALRRWLLERAIGRTAGPPSFIPHKPPYLYQAELDLGEPPPVLLRQSGQQRPATPITLALPGVTVTVNPGGEDILFQDWPDLETRLAVHRFAWLPLLGPSADPAWVARLWACWAERHGRPDESWAWHPYTVAERAANLLDFSRHHPLPPGAGDLLAAHPPAIAARLEYFGEHYTGNHLANNGRGLYLTGLALGWERCAALGLSILRAETGRLFGASGVLNEQSSHYHLLLTRNMLSCALAAEKHGRPEATELMTVATRAWSVLPHLALPGGLPLVGDISPDCPPEFLAGLLPGGDLRHGWCAWLSEDERRAVAALQSGPAADAALLRADGWTRFELGDWIGLWHVSPMGWPAMPGHAHQDLGAAEMHWRGQAVFIDPGRGSYGESGEAALYRSAAVHGLLQVDGADPYPPNRPYYDPAFRHRLGGAEPVLRTYCDRVELNYRGFAAQGITAIQRSWRFEADGLILDDTVEGKGRHDLTRRLVTPFPVSRDRDGLVIATPAGGLRVTADAPLSQVPMRRWTAYGTGTEATLITAQAEIRPPWRGSVRMFPA